MPNFKDKDYKIPETKGGYINKLKNGETRLRIVSEAVVGRVDREDKKPVRTHEEKDPLGSLDPQGNEVMPKHFRAVAVWDYESKSIKIWEITSKKIMEGLMSYDQTPEYGIWSGYDIKVKREGEGLKTKYSVVAMPPKAMDADVKKAVKETPVNLEGLFDGTDPFDVEDEPFDK